MTPLKKLVLYRSSAYGDWHRPPTLPDDCAMSDADWFEVRNGKVVACVETMVVPPMFIESSQEEYKLWETKTIVLKEILNKMNIPILVVRHTSDCKNFALSYLTPNGGETKQQVMSEEEYIRFLSKLGEGHYEYHFS